MYIPGNYVSFLVPTKINEDSDLIYRKNFKYLNIGRILGIIFFGFLILIGLIMYYIGQYSITSQQLPIKCGCSAAIELLITGYYTVSGYSEGNIIKYYNDTNVDIYMKNNNYFHGINYVEYSNNFNNYNYKFIYAVLCNHVTGKNTYAKLYFNDSVSILELAPSNNNIKYHPICLFNGIPKYIQTNDPVTLFKGPYMNLQQISAKT